MLMTKSHICQFLTILTGVFLCACSASRDLPEESYMLDKVKVLTDGKYKDINLSQMKAYVRQKTNSRWFSTLKIPLGVYATADDVYKLQLDSVVSHWKKHYILPQCNVVLAGNLEGDLCAKVSEMLGAGQKENAEKKRPLPLPKPTVASAGRTLTQKIPTATQTSIRIGRILPIAWDSSDYARFILLTTILGGWFGSRLMRNIREDKGYTYGIYARTQIYRGCIVFYITADVAANTADDAVSQVFHELEQLAACPVSEEELALVKNVLVGDFLRSVDGIFELSSRYCDMLANGVDECLTDNLRKALNETTAAELQELAQRLLRVEEMTVCTAGV